MKNFARALRLALRYRWTFAGSIVSAIIVAVMWGGNIGTLFPIVEVVFKGQSLQTWVREQIDSAETAVAQFQQKAATVERQLAALDARGDADPAAAAASRRSLERQLSEHRARIAAEQSALAGYRRIQPYIDTYSPTGPFQTLLVVIGLFLLGTVIKDLFLVVGHIQVERLAQLATFDLRKEFYRRTLRLDLASFKQHSQSDIIARFTSDTAAITGGVQYFYGRLIREPLKMLVCAAGAAWICWRLLLLTLIVAPLAAVLVSSLAKSLKRASRRAMEEMSQLYNVLSETFGGIKVVKAFTMERQERNRFHRGAKQFYRRAMKVARYDALVRPTTELMGILMICLAILAGAYLVLNDATHLLGIKMSDRPIELSSMLLFYALLLGASDPARKLSDVFAHLQRAAAAADRVYEMLDREPKVADSPTAVACPRHARSLEFENVDFHYMPDQPVLCDVNLSIAHGETVAIVGANGCGKSTLVSLAPRFFDPVRGSVKLDGVDLRDVRHRELRRQIGLVSQETLLFDDTVLNNIRYGAPQATRDEVIRAAKQAHAHRFITEQLEDGYDTVVGFSGGRLSGGQRQRIALARAILRDPAILILDEATSQIDIESEQLIHKVLSDFIRNRTTLIVTHRTSTLVLADRIAVMDGGRIVEVGTHEQLLGRCELYQRLHHDSLRQSA